MAKTKISEFSSTPSENTDIDSINIAEGCAPSGINNAIRELMAQLKDFQTGAVGDSFNGPIGSTTPSAGAFTTLSASGAFTYGGVTLSNAVTGTGNMVLSNSPTLVTPALGTPSALVGTNITGTAAGLSIGGNAATATTSTNVSGGTASVTTLSASGAVTLNGGTANGVAYLNGSKVLTTGSALTFDGSFLGIGVSPGVKLDVGGSIRAIDSSAVPFLYLNNGTTQHSISNNAGTMPFAISGSEQMRLTSTGLGIGTSSPVNKLSVSNAGANGLEVAPAGTNSGTNILSINRSTSSFTTLNYYANDHRFYYGASNTEGLRLDSSGNLGLGVTPSAWTTASSIKVFQNPGGALWNFSTNNIYIGQNYYWDGSNRIYINTAAATEYNQGSGQHRWFTAPSGTAGDAISFSQVMTLNSSGNLGIGTSSPNGKLTIGYSSALIDGLIFNNTATNGRQWRIGDGSGTFAGNFGFYDATAALTRLTIDSSGNLGLGVTPSAWTGGAKAFELLGGSLLSFSSGALELWHNAYFDGAVRYKTSAAASTYVQTQGQHRFFTAPSGTAGDAISFTQAATLTAGGNFLVGGTSDSNDCRFVVTNTNSTRTWGFGTSGSATAFYVLDDTSGSGVYITAGATSWTGTSDERLKTDLIPIQNAAQKVSTLRAVTGRFKTDAEGTSRAFLIAQDVQAVLPEAVDATNPDKLGVSYTDVIPLLVAAIKELKAEFDSYKASHP